MRQKLYEKYKDMATIERIEHSITKARQYVAIAYSNEDEDLIYKEACNMLDGEFTTDKSVVPEQAPEYRLISNRRFF